MGGQEAFPTRRRLLLAASSTVPLLLLPPPSLVTTSTSPLSPSSAAAATARISLVEAGEEGRGESRAYGRKQQGWVERPMRIGSVSRWLRKVANRSSRSKELEEVQIGYKWFSKEGVCNCNRDKAMEEECVAGLCKFSPSRDKEQQHHGSAGKGGSWRLKMVRTARARSGTPMEGWLMSRFGLLEKK